MNEGIIKRIDVFLPDKTMNIPYFFSGRDVVSCGSVFIRITCRAGDNIIYGWGEASPINARISGSTPDIIAQDLERRISKILLSTKISTVQSVLDIYDGIKFRNGMSISWTAADMALFDLVGRLNNRSVFHMIREYLSMPSLNINENQSYPLWRTSSSDFLGGGEYEGYGDLMEEIEDFSRIRSIIQPFPPQLTAVYSLLMKKLSSIKNPPEVIADESARDILSLKNLIVGRLTNGAILRPGGSGGFSFLIRAVELLRDYPDFNVMIGSMGDRGVGISANLHYNLCIWEIAEHMFGLDPGCIDNRLQEPNLISPLTDISDGILDNGRIFPGRYPLGEPGLGCRMDVDFLEKVTRAGVVISMDGNRLVSRRFPYFKNKPDFRKVEEFIIEGDE